MVAWLISLQPVCLHIRMRIYILCLKQEEKQFCDQLSLIKKVNRSFKMKVCMYSYINVWLHAMQYFSQCLQSHAKVNLFVFFASTRLCTHKEPQLVHACLHEMYLQAFFEQVVLHALTEVIASVVTHVSCEGIIACNYPSSLNQAIPYIHRFALKFTAG